MKQLFIGFVALAFLLVGTNASAQESAMVVAKVRVQNCHSSQAGDQLTISCDFVNAGDTTQADVRYAVQLVAGEGEAQSTATQQVYPEVLTLGAGQKIPKTISYTIPGYVNGEVQVWVIARNSEGLPLSSAKAGAIAHTAMSGYAMLSACYLTLSRDTSNTHYTLRQGVDIAATESLTAYCQAKNLGDTPLNLSVAFDTHRRNIFGEVVQAEEVTNNPVVLEPSQAKEISFTLPHPKEPQAYDTVVTLEANGTPVSNSVAMHYVIQGASATIQNISIDRNAYNQGDTAQVTAFWTPSADSFPGSRAGGTNAQAKSMVATLMNQGEMCGEATQDVTSNVSPQVTLSVPLQQDCSNPSVTVKILDANGKVLAEKTVNLTPTKGEMDKSQPVSLLDRILNNPLIIAVLIALLPLIGFGIYWWRNRQQSPWPPAPPSTGGSSSTFSVFLLFFAFGVAFLLGTPTAQADTFTVGAYTFTATLEDEDYVFAPGETMVTTGQGAEFWFCANGVAHSNALTAENLPTGEQENYFSATGQPVTAEFTAPYTAGTYILRFTAHTDGGGSGTYDFTYTVSSSASGPPTATLSANPTSINSGETSTLTYTCANATSGSIDNGVGALTPVVNGTKYVFPTATTTYTLTCTGPGGTGTDQATVTVTSSSSSSNTLKVCQNSCSSGIQRGNTSSTQSLSLAQGSSQNLVACWNTTTNCSNPTGNVTASATWGENAGSNVVSLSGSDPKTVSANAPGSEGISASYSGQTANITVNVLCVPSVTCASSGQGANYCETQTYSVDNGCGTTLTCNGTKNCDGFNWREVAP